MNQTEFTLGLVMRSVVRLPRCQGSPPGRVDIVSPGPLKVSRSYGGVHAAVSLMANTAEATSALIGALLQAMGSVVKAIAQHLQKVFQ